jgi:hypothetical protein
MHPATLSRSSETELTSKLVAAAGGGEAGCFYLGTALRFQDNGGGAELIFTTAMASAREGFTFSRSARPVA